MLVVEFNLADLFEAVAATVPDNEALVCSAAGQVTVRRTYADLDERSNRLAHVFRAEGIRAHDFVGLHLYNGAEFIEAMLALFKLRAVPVNVNYRSVPDELRYIFVDSGMRAVVTEPEFVPSIAAIRNDVPALISVLRAGADYSAALTAQSAGPLEQGARSGDDMYVLYTGGTTGSPKGVVWRHEDLYFAALGGRGRPSKGVPMLTEPDQIIDRVRRGDLIMRRLPLCPLIHGGAMWVALQTLLTGGALILDTGRHFDAEIALDLISSERVALVMVIGDGTARPLADALARDRARFDMSSLQVIASAGAVLSASVKSQLQALLSGVSVVDTLGASETGGQGHLRRSDIDGSLQLVADVDTAVFDDELRPVAPGQIGRLARSGNIPLRYHGDAEKTASTFPTIDGVRWSVPGDLARVEGDGAITLLGRGSTSINTGGEKVFPEEVENVIKGYPAVFDALVVGIDDERFGEQVVAVISSRSQAEPPVVADLVAYCRLHLSGYKVPRKWILVDHCERLPTGKAHYKWARTIASDPTTRPLG